MNQSWLRFGIIIGLALSVVLIFWPLSKFDFIQYDDPIYVTENKNVLRGVTTKNLVWAATTFQASNWHPVTWLSHMIDVELFGVQPGAHHLINLLLHLLNTLLLFDLLHRMTGTLWRSAFVAALFGLHPMHIESVAWIAERKDLLCALFWLLATGAYLQYTQRAKFRRYVGVVIFFALALMSKPTAVTFPFTLLLLDYWPLNRFDRSAIRVLVGEKIPLFVMSALSSVVTIAAQHGGGAVASLEVIPLSDRLTNSLMSYGTYLLKTVRPVDLAIFYPFTGQVSVLSLLLVVGLLLAVTILVIYGASSRPFLPVGWFWYLGTLIPVIGIVQVGGQAMAARYMYIPSIGIFIMVSWVMASVAKGRSGAVVMTSIGIVLLIGSSIMTYRQLQFWKSSEALFSRAIAVTGDNWRVHVNLGSVLESKGRYQEAFDEYQKAGRIRPDRADIFYNMGHAAGAMERWTDSVAFYRAALRLDPAFDKAHYNLAKIYVRLEDAEQALDHLQEAIRINPEFVEAYNDLGVLLFNMGKPNEAAAAFQKALSIKPDYFEALSNLHYVERKMQQMSNKSG